MNQFFNQYKFILVLSQRDIKHPFAGGAEVYTHNALRELAKEIYVVHLSGYNQKIRLEEEMIDGIHYIRKGKSLLSTTFQALKFYIKYKKQILAVIDHSNTHQFFTFLWCRSKRIFFIHQLALDIWDYFFGKVIGRIFRMFEELLMFLSKGTAITVSQSTQKDLESYGFKNIYICTEGNYIKFKNIPNMEQKEDYLIYTGRLVPYKRVEDAIILAHKAKRKLYIVGRGSKRYTNKLNNLIKSLNADCEMMGFLKKEDKEELIRKAYMLIMPSIREGWGLVITESANLGTPSLVYPVNGVVEAVDYGKAGFIAGSVSPEAMFEKFKEITPEIYEKVRNSAFENSLKFTWEATAQEFKETIKKIFASRGIDYDSFRK